jgi:amphi-Trp domain-containing protein
MKKHKIEYDERRSLASTVEQLQSVVDGLRSRALTIAHGDRRLLFLLAPGSPLELSIHAERSGNRERLEISLEWRRQHLRIGASASEAGPEADDALEGEQLEEGVPEELDDDEVHDEEEDDDWEDQAETVRQGSNLLALALQQNSLGH